MKLKIYSAPVKVRLRPDDLTRLTQVSRDTGISVQELVRGRVSRALPYIEQRARSRSKDQPG